MSLGVFSVNIAHPAMLLCVGVSLLNVAWRVVVSGPAVSQWSPAFDPGQAAKCSRRPHLHFPFLLCLMHAWDTAHIESALLFSFSS